MDPRDADHNDLKFAPKRRLRLDYFAYKQLIVSTEDGATCGIGSVQWRHHVMMMITSLNDQDSRNFTCSTWQLWKWLPRAK